MKRRLNFLHCILIAALLTILVPPAVSCSRRNHRSTRPAVISPAVLPYGVRVKFEQDQTLRFPDFELTYAGGRRVTPPQFPRGWWAYDFRVRAGDGEQTVSWSAGTGDIGPVRFSVGSSAFQIELVRSDSVGALAEDELVVSEIR